MSQEPLEIRARSYALRTLQNLQTGLYSEYAGEIDFRVYEALQEYIDIAIQGIKAVKM